ncbi:type 1 serine/threonine-protein phosphatase catalytic subunit glc7 [Metarhizium acridum]|nr:type 1 serine/threonine-protein phosphatase catalytic subunit glc7 [Metarhizium acridum]KAG8420289.1 type 1 serine/threonine-protein phosphatase catalytic subunit glc7 [Metarhizium acridum]
MPTPRYSTSRQKACRQCASAKARCDRRSGGEGCTRCAQRGLQCAIPNTDNSNLSATANLTEDGSQQPSPLSVSDLSFSFASPENTLLVTTPNKSTKFSQLDAPRTPVSRTSASEDARLVVPPSLRDGLNEINFSNLELVCPINPDDIQHRWIQAYLPVLGQTIKQYPSGVSGFIYRTLKSYASVAIKGRGCLPFIHSAQLISQPSGSPLTTCLSLVRICSNSLPGSHNAAATLIHREMDRLYERREDYDAQTLFAAFQAYLIYSLVLFFVLNHSRDANFREIMTNLQQLACSSAGQGLVCAAEQRRARPRWEEWIVCEAKLRTLYVMYLFDSTLCIQEGLPTFLGNELSGLPAPSNKLLWQAKSRYDWEKEYNMHMTEWMGESLTIDELWPMPADLDTRAVERRRIRVDHWLENLDEYGTMLYAVTRCTHGE